TNMVIAIFAKADAGSNRDVRLLDQKLGEFKRAQMPELFRYLRPCEHRCRRRRNIPAGPSKCIDHNVTAALINRTDFLDVGAVRIQSGGGRNLDRGEGAVIEI